MLEMVNALTAEWWPHSCHHDEESQGEDDIRKYGIQPFNDCSPEKKGYDSVSAGV
jgi:hypothetical protein